MRQLEVFYDYACPFCLKGHEILMELLPNFDDIEVVWCPCEAHPRPETWGPHSDLCIRGMYFAREQGADLLEYHKRMYKAALTDRKNVEEAEVVAAVADGVVDGNALHTALERGDFVDELNRGNDYAYEENGVWAVPSYRMDGKKLDAVEGVGVTREMVEAFLKG